MVDTIEELDVSGGAPLTKRHGLRRAVEMVESGQAEVVVVAYFDRLVRSLTVQAEVVERIERAGGAILAVDVGEVRADTASRWLSSTMHGLVAEYHRRSTSERTADAKRRAVMRGVPRFPNVPLATAGARTARWNPTPERGTRPCRERSAIARRASVSSKRQVRELHERRPGPPRSAGRAIARRKRTRALG
jgi:DNA invertase Pin-like site-specific DNA recombinase